MMIRQGRIYAPSYLSAIIAIYRKHGSLDIRCYPCPVQCRKGMVWWEYNVVI